MKERPILFSAPMVRAILDGTKSQTRRVIKPQPKYPVRSFVVDSTNKDHHNRFRFGGERDAINNDDEFIKCPYGFPDDRLWVRETWKYWNWTQEGEPYIRYRADDSTRLITDYDEEWAERLSDIWARLSGYANFRINRAARDRKWRPSIHMPRWASRITLEVTGVRVERVQDISNEDICWEGTYSEKDPPAYYEDPYACYEQGFIDLWDSINKKRGFGWDVNPWVWVIEFRRTI